jgi:hypothetical protein
MKPSHAVNDRNLIDRIRAVWQPRLGRDLSREDARQIAENVTGFFAVLAEWSRAETPVPRTTPASPPPPIPARCAMKAEAIAKGLGGRKAGGGWTAHCPAHDDRDGGGD